MANIKYTATLVNNTGVGYETYSTEDVSLASPFQINSTYVPTQNKIELHVYGLNDNRLTSIYNYTGTFQNTENYLNEQEGINAIYIDPVQDAIQTGFTRGGVKLLYNFLNTLSPESFFIKQISGDRTELIVRPSNPGFDSTALVQDIKDRLQSRDYFDEFRLNFLANDLLIGVNIDKVGNDILIKLYEPLPATYAEKAIFNFEEVISDSVTFEIQADILPEAPSFPKLKGPNFNLEVNQESVPPTQYLDYNELYSYPVTNTYYKAATLLSGSNVTLSINYSDYSDFIHFSSAKERLDNFKYKLGLIEQYISAANANSTILNANAVTSVRDTYYKGLISNIFAKFDDYEKFLYFESSSAAWPKSNSTPPYTNYGTATAQGLAYYQSQSVVAEDFDNLNESRLTYTIPEFIRDDANNAPYSLFLDMIGQHFDNLWVYAKGVTDKYDADNRLDYGVSKDIISDVLRSFGVKLYSSNFSINNLAASFLGEFYDSGSEQINQFITASNLPTPDNEILAETYKRIYHNLPYLIKTKGTKRGLRALMNCFGIADSAIDIQEFGGVLRNAPSGYLQQENSGYVQQQNTGLIILNYSPYFGNENFNQVRIRVDNTGSLASGSVLSRYVSIQPSTDKYTHDLHRIEVSISPTEYINTYLENNLTNSFDIDDYIGDPSLAYSSSYETLEPIASASLGGLNRYDVFDLIRLIKFYDNQLFKMIKDFVPARANTAAGIVIKPHYLNRSKYKRVKATVTQPEYSGSMSTAFPTGSSGDAFLSGSTTLHTLTVSTLSGSLSVVVDNERPTFDGELGGTEITATTQDLNAANVFKIPLFVDAGYTTRNYVNPTPAVDTTPSPGEITIIVTSRVIGLTNPSPTLPTF